MVRIPEGSRTLESVCDSSPEALPLGEQAIYEHSASAEAVALVLSQSEGDDNGRSQWLWIRLPNGDLILGVYPQGDTYFAVEVDAETPDFQGAWSDNVVP